MSNLPPPPPPSEPTPTPPPPPPGASPTNATGPSGGASHQRNRLPWILAGVAGLVAIILAVVVVTGGDDNGSATDSTQRTERTIEENSAETEPSAAVETTEAGDDTTTVESTESTDSTEPPLESTETTFPDASDVTIPSFDDESPAPTAVVGETVTFSDGSLGRVNSIESNVEALGPFADPPPAGSTYTRISVSYCANTTFETRPPTGLLGDGTWASESFGGVDGEMSYNTIAAGICSSGSVTFESPDTNPLAAVTIDGPDFEEIVIDANPATATPVDGPLQAPVATPTAALGEAFPLNWGASGTITAVRSGLTPPRPTRRRRVRRQTR